MPATNEMFTDHRRATVMVVDDTTDNLLVMSGLLRDRYRVQAASSGKRALHLLQTGPLPDLILLDILMPGMSGREVCQVLKADPALRAIPVIFLTAMTASDEEARGLEMGAVDFISKPVSAPIVLARVATQLKVKAATDVLRDETAYLEAEVRRRTEDITAVQDVTILAMASLAETRDNETGNHIRRTQHYVRTLARHLQHHPRFSGALGDTMIESLFKSAPLHDIGKVGIPDRILLKPGKFTPEEFEIMKTHTTLGRDAIEQAERRLGITVPFLQVAKEIAYSHQEKWDGSGYPEGLAGDAIPLSARLMAVADVYDALISRRVYKEGMPHEKAVDIIRSGRGQHFDPDITDAFLELVEVFHGIAMRYADDDATMNRKAEQLRFAGALEAAR